MDTADDGVLFPTGRSNVHIDKIVPGKAMRAIFDGQYTPHDLKRTAATRMSALGFNRLIVDKVLNHVDSSVGGIYDRYSYDDEKRDALTKWSNEIEAIIDQN